MISDGYSTYDSETFRNPNHIILQHYTSEKKIKTRTHPSSRVGDKARFDRTSMRYKPFVTAHSAPLISCQGIVEGPRPNDCHGATLALAGGCVAYRF